MANRTGFNYFLACCVPILVAFLGCTCSGQPTIEHNRPLFNLEALDLAIQGQKELCFNFNGQTLIQERDIYCSDDLIVYQNPTGAWQATVIGQGHIQGKLQISNQAGLVKEVNIANTQAVFGYQETLVNQWPKLHNIGNTCFANAIYKLLARCPGFDTALNQHTEDVTISNMVNGIRLGQRSALHHGNINKKISEQFLVTMSAKSGHNYSNRQANNGIQFYRDILDLWYVQQSIAIKDTDIPAWLCKPDSANLFARITQAKTSKQAKYVTYPLTSYANLKNFIVTQQNIFLQLPRFFTVWFTAGIQEIPETLCIPCKSNNKLSNKSYQLIGISNHLQGHRVAYIYSKVHGWYLHDDMSITKCRPSLKSAEGIESGLAIYELQD